ncbi:MAG: ferritin family protein [Candidatus Cloacimonadaceae bacterium]|jgi:rubrerythrin|nr:ferritin family protein [Candidatus Cloacimonadota bacterium]MDX9949361.1 ferritin family protein [Candidatus Syntrophosphaera sp.]
MTEQEFNEILDFAVQREQEAVQFYHDLQKDANFASQTEMLKELEDMELGHIEVIEGIRRQGVTQADIPTVPNLRISEYITADVEDLDLSYPNILIRAMKREENSFKLYSEMSQKFPDGEISLLFRKLASDEAKHKLLFERLYDDWISAGN